MYICAYIYIYTHAYTYIITICNSFIHSLSDDFIHASTHAVSCVQRVVDALREHERAVKEPHKPMPINLKPLPRNSNTTEKLWKKIYSNPELYSK